MLIKNDATSWRFLIYVILMPLVLGISSCMKRHSAGIPSSSNERSTNVDIHTWNVITQPPLAVWNGPRTALYTYVLIGDVGDGDVSTGSAQARAAKITLEKLLDEVRHVQRVLQVEKDLFVRVNQFCVPGHGPDSEPPTLKNYNFSLASNYMNWIKKIALLPEMAVHLRNVGPFLVATREPLGEIIAERGNGTLTINMHSPVLLMDLSGRHPMSMGDHFRAYKDTVQKIDPAQNALLEPLRPKIASLLLELNVAIPFVAEAFAGTQEVFNKAVTKAY